MEKKILGFIGAGNMAEAVIKGIIDKNIVNSECVFVSDIDKGRLEYIKKKYNINIAIDNCDLSDKCDLIFIAVKPQVSFNVLNEIKDVVNKQDKKIVSIMAGKKIEFIKSILGKNTNIVRVMPNTPALVGCGMSVISCNKDIDEGYRQYLESIFGAIGKVLFLSEDKMDIVTAVSGSGPAYIFNFAFSMINSAIENGLSEKEASLLVKHTFLGASKLMLESNDSPDILKDKVTSPGGTTEAALNSFDKNKIDDIIKEAVNRAKERSEELSNQ